jgi:ribulose-5-phosphate 4-epimerase/fuculose-1-phosphate aldolase
MSHPIAPELESVIDEHGPYMSGADEAEIIRRVVESDDVADLALRTCMCGRRLEGFDDYFEHLRVVVREATRRS